MFPTIPSVELLAVSGQLDERTDLPLFGHQGLGEDLKCTRSLGLRLARRRIWTIEFSSHPPFSELSAQEDEPNDQECNGTNANQEPDDTSHDQQGDPWSQKDQRQCEKHCRCDCPGIDHPMRSLSEEPFDEDLSVPLLGPVIQESKENNRGTNHQDCDEHNPRQNVSDSPCFFDPAVVWVVIDVPGDHHGDHDHGDDRQNGSCHAHQCPERVLPYAVKDGQSCDRSDDRGDHPRSDPLEERGLEKPEERYPDEYHSHVMAEAFPVVPSVAASVSEPPLVKAVMPGVFSDGDLTTEEVFDRTSNWRHLFLLACFTPQILNVQITSN